MKEQLVSLETAKLLKEKGFDWNTDYFVDTKGNLCYAQYYDSTPNNKLEEGDWFSRTEYGFWYTVPTQSLTQKWIRDKHNIHIWIENYPGYDKYFFQCPQLTDAEVEGKIDHYGNTYEECLEKGLIEALKLIK